MRIVRDILIKKNVVKENFDSIQVCIIMYKQKHSIEGTFGIIKWKRTNKRLFRRVQNVLSNFRINT